MILAKICGLSTPETVQAALSGDAAYIGFMMFAASARAVELAAAERLARPARGKSRVVVITVNPDDDLVDRIAAIVAPDFIQLHGRESPARVREIALRGGVGVIKAIAAGDAADVAAARAYESVASHLMFDAKPASASSLPGGTGMAFDWALLKGERFERPWFLAGGLDPWNVADAVNASGAPMVDVSSGVERGPGLKDATLIGAFLEAVRRV